MKNDLIIIIIGNQCSSVDVMVLNDIIEQAAGRHSRTSDHGGKCF